MVLISKIIDFLIVMLKPLIAKPKQAKLVVYL